jgi:acyl-CoA synthetase (NDP forming)
VTIETQGAELDRLLRPRSVAIVGVSAEASSIGGAVLANLERFGYRGDIHLVSRSHTDVGGRPCLPSVNALPAGIDVAVLAVPRIAVNDAVSACVRRRVGAAVIYAAGYDETGAAGRDEQEALARMARAGGLALCGPNCIGLVNFVDGIPLTYEPIAPLPNDRAPAVGIVAQSGAMAASLRFAFLSKGLAISHCVSTGNEAVLGVEDFLSCLVDDPRTRAIAIFAEQIRRPRQFLAAANKARRERKPIILMHPGRSRRARESAASHTGALAGNHAVMTALMAHNCVVMVDTMEELVDTAEILTRFPQPPSEGAAIITNSGAFKGFALDFCETIGLDLPQLRPETHAALRQVLPSFATIDNPLDTTGQTIKEPGIFTGSAQHLLSDPAVGSLTVAIVPGGAQQAMDKAAALLPSLSAATKPTAVAVMGDEVPLPAEFITSFRANNIPFFRSPERALRAMSHATTYGRRLAARRRVQAAPPLPVPRLDRIGVVPEYEGKAIVASLGIPVPRGGLARSMADAQRTAAEIGYPVVLKAQSPALAHKSEAGGVIVGIADDVALASAWDRLHQNIAAAHPALALDGVLVEAMAPPGLEMVVGGRRDPEWGPVVMVGLGGIWVEVLDDLRLMPANIDAAAIVAELSQLKAARLLHGSRGQPPMDVDALVLAIQQIGALLDAHPQIAEIDVNPLVVYPRGSGILALDVLLVTAPAT